VTGHALEQLAQRSLAFTERTPPQIIAIEHDHRTITSAFTQKVSQGLGKPKPEIRLDRPVPVGPDIIGKTETLMHKSILAMTAAVALAVTTASLAFARGPGGIGGGPGGGPGFAGPGGGAPTYPPGFSKGHKVGWHGNSVPPGWSKGNKKGWNGHNVPPGLYGRL
jgi:hypothetical protein